MRPEEATKELSSRRLVTFAMAAWKQDTNAWNNLFAVRGDKTGTMSIPNKDKTMSKEMRKYIDTFKGRMLKENVEVNQQKSIQHIINNEIVDRFDTGNVSITTAIEAVKIAYQEIIDMIELNFETVGELGGGITEAQSIINRIEEFKKRAKENF